MMIQSCQEILKRPKQTKHIKDYQGSRELKPSVGKRLGRYGSGMCPWSRLNRIHLFSESVTDEVLLKIPLGRLRRCSCSHLSQLLLEIDILPRRLHAIWRSRKAVLPALLIDSESCLNMFVANSSSKISLKARNFSKIISSSKSQKITDFMISIQVPTKDTNVSKKTLSFSLPRPRLYIFGINFDIMRRTSIPNTGDSHGFLVPRDFTLPTGFTHAMIVCMLPWIFVTWTTGINYKKLQNIFVQRSNVLGSGQFDAPGRHFMSNSALIVSYGINVAIWRWSQFFTASWGSTWWREAIGFGNSF